MPGRERNEIVNDLARAFPDHLARLGQRAADELMGYYLRDLADIPPDVLDQAVRTAIRSSDHFPRLRAIREAAAEIRLHLPTEAEALAQVYARIRWGREPEPDRGAAPPLHPLVAEALEHVGGFHAFRAADEPGVVRGQFGRLFRDLRATRVRADQHGVAA